MLRFLPLCAVMGCTTLSGARPLAAGQHEVGVVVGGPLLEFGGPLPLPNLVLAGRSGLPALADRPFDLGYGLNATGLPFGIVALHGDLGWQLNDQNRALPAFTVRNKVFFATNVLAPGKVDGAKRGVWAADEIDVYASWALGESVVYGSLGQVFDVGAPRLVLVPGVGTSIDPGAAGGLKLQLEARWWAVNRSSNQNSVNWIPKNPGAIGITVGVAYGFGKESASQLAEGSRSTGTGGAR
ncbi:MAG: hypothetical protein R3F61_04995 [Myxococcota bacterium]